MGNLWDFSVGWRAGRELGHKSLKKKKKLFYFVLGYSRLTIL